MEVFYIFVNDVGKTMPPQTGVRPEEQPGLNATGKVTFRLSKSVATMTTTTDESFPGSSQVRWQPTNILDHKLTSERTNGQL